MLHIQLFTFRPIEENTYVLYNDAGQACIIDPGCYYEQEEKTLDTFLQEKKLTPTLLLNTHCHLDHVFGLRWAAKTYQLTPHIHPNEEQMLQLSPLAGDRWGMPFKGYGGPLIFLKEDNSIFLGDDELSILFAPGHSPGHVCFYSKTQGFLIGGDVLFKESIGRTDLPGGNHQVLVDSIRYGLFTLPNETVVYPGHGGSTTIGHEKKYNPYLIDN